MFDSFMELSSLHPRYFKPNEAFLKKLNISTSEPYILIRFVSWEANHDIKYKGIKYSEKKLLINTLKKHYKILISSEQKLPEEFKEHAINITPEMIHHILAYAVLFIGEGATMASECAMLGTPAIYVNPITSGTIEEQEKLGLLFSYRNFNGILEKSFELLSNDNIKSEFQNRRMKLLANKIDITAFMVWFIENYPESFDQLRTNSQIQHRFK